MTDDFLDDDDKAMFKVADILTIQAIKKCIFISDDQLISIEIWDIDGHYITYTWKK